MRDTRPGLNTTRLARLVRQAVERCGLNLRGRVVFTEAATGAYAVTPVLAARAGAERVFALARPSRFGTVAEARCTTEALAAEAGVAGRVRVVTEKRPDLIREADVVTNSGHVRPIDRETVECMRPGAVVPLMYECWELRPEDVNLEACLARGIRVAGTNERHPQVDVFSYLGAMAVRLLTDAGVAVRGSRVVVVSDNPFGPYIHRGLEAAGASVTSPHELSPAALQSCGECDAVLVAAGTGPQVIVGRDEARALASAAPSAVVVQFWGDLDRAGLDAVGVPYWPPSAPPTGHMGILPSALGPEPVVRLQAGGLKVAEVLLRAEPGSDDWRYLDPL
ncbi:hypothetical protein J0H58_14410 [bacterium]|nr:hypothetical protein [bacterium]